MRLKYIIILFFVISFSDVKSQTENPLPKLSHCEPLYMDLVRDLGAQEGREELNIGLSLEDKLDFHTMSGLVEYEFAPANRLGLEIEMAFSIHFKTDKRNENTIPNSFQYLLVNLYYKLKMR